jgi:tellurite resistance protein TerC
MNVSTIGWVATLVGIALIFVFDFAVMGRRPHTVSMREASLSAGFYVALAVAFGFGIWIIFGHQYGTEFFAGYVTELSLSVDNLFVFSVIMTSFAVPRTYQLRVLQLGIIGALVLRFAFILVGAAALAQFNWLFFVFGAFLIWTAVKLALSHGAESEPEDSKILKLVERVLPTTTQYHEGKFAIRVDGKRVFTPLFIVIVAIFLSDIMFALDSIPAIFGLTSETYIVFTANAFALMGLRQMYFLLDGLLDRLVFLSLGLSVVLGFIGFKLILHAAHEYGFDVIDINTGTSLIVIVVTLAVTVLASLAKARKTPEIIEMFDVTGHHHEPGEGLEDLRLAEGHVQEEAPSDSLSDPPQPTGSAQPADDGHRSGPDHSAGR